MVYRPTHGPLLYNRPSDLIVYVCLFPVLPSPSLLSSDGTILHSSRTDAQVDNRRAQPETVQGEINM